MATDAENLATIISNNLAIIASITANPKPSYSIHGQSVDWNEYRRILWQEINDARAVLGIDPYEIHSEAYT